MSFYSSPTNNTPPTSDTPPTNNTPPTNTCSQVFSGVLPEITFYILQYLRNDFKTLFSCALVSRFLCCVTIPILWEDPFSLNARQRHPSSFLEIYLLFIDEMDKATLREFGVPFDSPFKEPLFNYPSFLRTLHTGQVDSHAIHWINNKSVVSGADPNSHLMNMEEIKNIMCVALLGPFLSHAASLNELILFIMHDHDGSLFEFHQWILSHSKFVSKVEKLKIRITYNYRDPKFDFQTLLNSLSSMTSIVRLETYTLEDVGGLIQSQKHLSYLKIHPITSNGLDALKGCSNTLTWIEFNNCDFNKVPLFDKLKPLSRLKTLKFQHCRGITIHTSQSRVSFKLQSLKIDSSDVSGIDTLLRMVGPHLENLDWRVDDVAESRNLYQGISSHCHKIRFLNLSRIHYQNLPQLYGLMFRLGKSLKCLSLQNFSYLHSSGMIIDSEILEELGSSLPDTLEYLELYPGIGPEDLKIFLDHCKHINLSRLLIKDDIRNDVVGAFNVLKEFVREKEVLNFAYQVGSSLEPVHPGLQNLGRLVDELPPLVRMKRYDELVLDPFDG